MQKILKKELIVSFIGLIVFLLPQNSFAAELIFKLVPNDRIDEKKATIEVWINPQLKKLNVVEGTIKFDWTGDEDLSVEVSNDKSVLNIWPTAPVYLSKEKIVRFTGGVPGGFDKEGLLFRVNLKPVLVGNINISWVSGTAYLNDGKGTKETIVAKDMIISQDTLMKAINDLSIGKPSQYNVILLLILVTIFVALFLYVQKKK